MTTIQQPTITTARKEHKCDYCLDKIRIGEKYLSSTHVQDGDIYDWHTHKLCGSLADKLDMYDMSDDGVSSEDFMEIASDDYFSILISMVDKEDAQKYRDVLKELHGVSFRNKLRYLIRHYKLKP